MKDTCWQCGRKLILPYFAEVRDYDGNVLRVHKICELHAKRILRPANFGETPASGRRMPCRDSDLR